MTVQLSTGCGRNAELAAGRKEKVRETGEVKRSGVWSGRDVVATWSGCFQPRRQDYGDCKWSLASLCNAVAVLFKSLVEMEGDCGRKGMDGGCVEEERRWWDWNFLPRASQISQLDVPRWGLVPRRGCLSRTTPGRPADSFPLAGLAP